MGQSPMQRTLEQYCSSAHASRHPLSGCALLWLSEVYRYLNFWKPLFWALNVSELKIKFVSTGYLQGEIFSEHLVRYIKMELLIPYVGACTQPIEQRLSRTAGAKLLGPVSQCRPPMNHPQGLLGSVVHEPLLREERARGGARFEGLIKLG